MRVKQFPFYPADASNYTRGRGGRSIKYFTVHHTAGFEATLRYLWGNPARNGSSHFFAGDNSSEQYVDTVDTAWTNGNWQSNQESITCETRGDWRNGYRDGTTLNQLAEVMYRCLKAYPNLKLTYHQDVSDQSTACPADLKHKGYALECWNKAKNRIKVEQQNAQPKPTPTPSPKPTLRVDIPDKKVILIRDTNLWDMSFKSFATARAVKALPKGTVIDVAGVYDHPLSKTDYYLSNYSWNAGQNYGISKADCQDYVAPKPAPVTTPKPDITPPPKNPVTTPPIEEKPSAGTLPPIPVDPNGEKINEILVIVRWIKNLLAKIFKGE